MSHLYNNQSQSPVHPSPSPCGRVWGGVFFSHNLKTAWRNLLKYKVQNIISIACLAVGVVCFAITVHIMFNFARNLYYSSIDQGRPVFNIYEMSEEEFKNTAKHDANGADRQLPMVNITKAFIDRLYSMKLPAMKEVHGIVLIMRSDFEFDDNTPQPKIGRASCRERV